MLTTTDASGQTADADFPKVVKLPENKDLSIVAAEHFNASDVSVTAQLVRIKALNPQILVVWAPGTPFGTALRGMRDVGTAIPVMTTGANMSMAVMKQYAALLPADLYFIGGPFLGNVGSNPQIKAAETVFFGAIKPRGIPSDELSGMAWDPANIVVDALRHLGPAADADQLRKYIANLGDFGGIRGVYDFRGNQRGLSDKDLVILRWDGEKTTWVAESKFGGTPLR